MKTGKYLLTFLFFLFLATDLLPAQQKLKVVTTLNYLRYLVEQVGGDRVEAIALANPKQDPHYVTPTPRMNQVATDADLFVENGLNLDMWAKNVIDASGNPKIQPGTQGHLIATLNVPVKELPIEVSRAWGDIHPQGNPHLWLDPLNVRIIAENIADRLKKLDPSSSNTFENRLRGFTNHLDVAMFGGDLVKAMGNKGGDILVRKARNGELEEWLLANKLDGKLGGWLRDAARFKNAKVMSYHKTYIYFCDRFGLEIAGELEEKPGIPPPPQHRDAVVEQMKRENIRIILNDNFYSRDASDYVASKCNARVIVTYIEVGATPEMDTYEKLISYLVDQIRQAII